MRGALVSLRAGRQPSPLFGGGNALESGPLHRTMVGVHRHDSRGAMSLGVTLSVTRAGWVRRTWRRWLQGLMLILLAFGASLVGTGIFFILEGTYELTV